MPSADPKVPVHPHPLANELTDEPLTPEPEPAPGQGEPLLTRTERRVTRTVLLLAGGLACVALVVAAILFSSWEVFLVGALFAMAYMILLAAPVFLAQSTKAAQDEAAKEGQTAAPAPAARSRHLGTR